MREGRREESGKGGVRRGRRVRGEKEKEGREGRGSE